MKHWRLFETGEPVPPVALSLYQTSNQEWIDRLQSLGFVVTCPDGLVGPKERVQITIEYLATLVSKTGFRLRIYNGEKYEELEIKGRVAEPKLSILDIDNRVLLPDTKVDLGCIPVGSDFCYTMQLSNTSLFGVDFLIQPFSIPEFEVYPIRGFIPPEQSTAVKVLFRPTSESTFLSTLKVMWEKEPLKFVLSGSGGIGKLEVVYADEKDGAAKELDFGIIPVNTSHKKNVYLLNVGMVGITVRAEVDNDDYILAQVIL